MLYRWFKFFFKRIIFVCCGVKRCRKWNHFPSWAPATGPVRHPGEDSRMVSSCGLTAQPARTLAVNVVLLCVSPLTPEKLFCVSTEASFFSWRNAPLWPLQRRWVCCRKISDQRDVSGRNVIRPAVVKLLWYDDRSMLAVLRVTGAGFLRCLLAPETSLVNPISEWESAAHQESKLISACADSGSCVWEGKELFLRPQ